MGTPLVSILFLLRETSKSVDPDLQSAPDERGPDSREFAAATVQPWPRSTVDRSRTRLKQVAQPGTEVTREGLFGEALGHRLAPGSGHGGTAAGRARIYEQLAEAPRVLLLRGGEQPRGAVGDDVELWAGAVLSDHREASGHHLHHADSEVLVPHRVQPDGGDGVESHELFEGNVLGEVDGVVIELEITLELAERCETCPVALVARCASEHQAEGRRRSAGFGPHTEHAAEGAQLQRVVLLWPELPDREHCDDVGWPRPERERLQRARVARGVDEPDARPPHGA
mmetsp:Transcript_14484/g.31377  ORF Transcript_14484/g.31377 Transcript_14484/m.31377 type:complete len:284 (+) Transcript_14484:124-975(+)